VTTTTAPGTPAGQLIRSWRQRRRLTQLDLALASQVSTRHLSFVETGRSRPTSRLILNLSDQLEIPLRERNQILLAAGFAPAYPQHGLADTPMAAVSDAISQILDAHEPYPAVVVDRHWEMVMANEAVGILTEGCAPDLLAPPVNVLRLSLHPRGMAGRIRNLGEWRGHILHRLEHQLDRAGDPALADLLKELRGYPGEGSEGDRGGAQGGRGGTPGWDGPTAALVVPLRVSWRDRELPFISTTTVFGTPLDVTVAELAIEAFYPADPETAAVLRAAAGAR
jgi:transcriptional regulator with XRE-family HTH domain